MGVAAAAVPGCFWYCIGLSVRFRSSLVLRTADSNLPVYEHVHSYWQHMPSQVAVVCLLHVGFWCSCCCCCCRFAIWKLRELPLQTAEATQLALLLQGSPEPCPLNWFTSAP